MISRMFGRDLGDPVDDRVAEGLAVVVPGAQGRVQVVRRVLDEAADDVLAGRGHRRVDEGRNDHVDVRPAAPAAVLRVVVGALHVVERGAVADRPAEVLALAGQAGEVGQAVDGQVDLARRAPELEAADLLLELGLEACPARAGRGRSAGRRPTTGRAGRRSPRPTRGPRPPPGRRGSMIRATGASSRISAPWARAALPIALETPPVPPRGMPQARNAPSISPM